MSARDTKNLIEYLIRLSEKYNNDFTKTPEFKSKKDIFILNKEGIVVKIESSVYIARFPISIEKNLYLAIILPAKFSDSINEIIDTSTLSNRLKEINIEDTVIIINLVGDLDKICYPLINSRKIEQIVKIKNFEDKLEVYFNKLKPELFLINDAKNIIVINIPENKEELDQITKNFNEYVINKVISHVRKLKD